MVRTLFNQWRETSRSSRYPFADSSPLQISTAQGIIELDESVFLDAVLFPIGSTERLRISFISKVGEELTLYVGDARIERLASTTFDVLNPPEVIRFADVVDRPAGMIVADPEVMPIFQSWPEGDFSIPIGTMEFVGSVVAPMPEIGIRGILTEEGDLLTGDVWLVGEDGVVLTTDDDSNIRIDIVGDPLFKRRLCSEASLFATPRFIKTINGIAPDSDGGFLLLPGKHEADDQILRLYPSGTDALKVELVGTGFEN